MNPDEANPHPPRTEQDLARVVSLPLDAPRGSAATPLDPLSGSRDDHLYEELSRTNNELANLQRETARANAELAAAQKKLRASEQRYLSLSACSPLGILEMDAAGGCRYGNPHWLIITGLTAEESLGDGWLRALDALDAPAFREEWKRAVGAVSEFSREVRFVTTHGDQRFAQVRSRPIRAEHGEVVGHVLTIEEITGRKRAEAALEKANQELADVSRQAGMAEVAIGVLRNVGHVLNSVNVATTLASDHVRHNKAVNLAKLAALFEQHKADLAVFLTQDSRGVVVPSYLGTLAESLAAEQNTLIAELKQLRKNVEQIKEIVAVQQNYAKTSEVIEKVAVAHLVEEALRTSASFGGRADVELVRDFRIRPVIKTDKHTVMQILTNLVRNAKAACDDGGRPGKRITVRITGGARNVQILVGDNGVGIAPENLPRVFSPGFGPRKPGVGHGFGLQSGALAAQQLGGSLSVESAGTGKGATFVLTLPLAAEAAAP